MGSRKDRGWSGTHVRESVKSPQGNTLVNSPKLFSPIRLSQLEIHLQNSKSSDNIFPIKKDREHTPVKSDSDNSVMDNKSNNSAAAIRTNYFQRGEKDQNFKTMGH